MKNIVLTTDGPYYFIYNVPDEIANNLLQYCLDFEKWFHYEPRFDYKRRNGYDPMDELINYLVTEVNADWKDQIEFVEVLDCRTCEDEEELSKYENNPTFVF